MGAFVVLSFTPYEPIRVYGTFATEAEADAYAVKHRLGEDGDAYQVHEAHLIERGD